MSTSTINSRRPRSVGSGDRKDYGRTEQETIDEDLHVKIFRQATSPNWYVQYNHPVMGQRKQSLRTQNKKEARRKAWSIVVKVQAGDLGSTVQRGPRLKEAIEGFLADKRRVGRRETTLTEYRRTLEQFLQFASEDGITRLDQLTPTHMERFEARLRESGIALKRNEKSPGRPAKKNKSTSVHEKIKVVKSLAKWAVSMLKIRENPIRGYALPADGEPDNYAFTNEEVEAICQYAEPFFSDVFRFLALTGLRQGELMWLTKDDLDASRRLLRVRAKAISEDGQRWRPKGDDRDVPLSEPALAIAERMANTSEGPWLFAAPPAPGVVDARLRPSRLWAHLKRAKKAAGVERGTLHGFRHYFVSTMANANVSPFKVMKIVGHTSLDIILTYYHVLDAELLSAVDGVQFGPAAGASRLAQGTNQK